MKAIRYITTLALLIPLISMAERKSESDTVIIELNNNSKIVIYTKSRADLAELQKYDINQMIRDLNAQLGDSVEYLVINDEGKEYVDDNRSPRIGVQSDGINLDLGGLSVEVDPDEMNNFDEDDWYNRRKTTYETDRTDRTTHHFNVDIGLNNWLEDGNFPDANNSPYSVKPFGSWYVGLNSTNRTWVGGPLFIEWGLGLNWYNWKFEDADFRAVKTDTNVDFIDDPNQNGLKSKLTASYLNASFVPMFDFSRGRRRVRSIEAEGIRIKRYSRKGIRFGMGGYVGYRLGSHTKYIYKEGGSRDKEKERDNFYLENLRYGLRGQIGWKGVELFGTYDLNEVFSSGRGPALNAVSFGITL
ncbi:MAG: hypothetical protein RIM99_05675 [Cyclobacteriaceae bacterium]